MLSLHASLLQGCLARQGKGATRRGTQHTISLQPAAVGSQPAATGLHCAACSTQPAATSPQPAATSLHHDAKGITPHPPVAIYMENQRESNCSTIEGNGCVQRGVHRQRLRRGWGARLKALSDVVVVVVVVCGWRRKNFSERLAFFRELSLGWAARACPHVF